MAGADEIRRSVRATRISQHAASSIHSSNSSSSSSHQRERPSRADSSHIVSSNPTDENNQHNTPTKAEASHNKMRSTRRNAAAPTQPLDSSTTTLSKSESEVIEEDGEEDDGTVRCLCERAEYPGPPQCLEDDKKQHGDLDFIRTEEITEETAGFFLQCDTCKVWQHGGCVGIKNEEVSPDEYYCEQCRSTLHKKFIAANGQKYSLYLPLQANYSPSSSRAGSFSKDGDPRARGSSALHHAKRRSTMNSRVAYDEEEQLRLAIEASKGDNSESIDGGAPSTSKRGRRGQSDSVSLDKHSSSKRQRSDSTSQTPDPKLPNDVKYDPDNGFESSDTQSSWARRRAVVKNYETKEIKAQQEGRPLNAPNPREYRAQRRLAADEQHSPPMVPVTKRNSMSVTNQSSGESYTTVTTSAKPDMNTTVTPATASVAPTPSHKKGGRPPSGKKGKLGRNQYSKNLTTPTVTDKIDTIAEDANTHVANKDHDDTKDVALATRESAVAGPQGTTFLTKVTKRKSAMNGGQSHSSKFNQKNMADPQRQIEVIQSHMSRLYSEQTDDAFRLTGSGLKIPLIDPSTEENDATAQWVVLTKQVEEWMVNYGSKAST